MSNPSYITILGSVAAAPAVCAVPAAPAVCAAPASPAVPAVPAAPAGTAVSTAPTDPGHSTIAQTSSVLTGNKQIADHCYAYFSMSSYDDWRMSTESYIN